MFEMPFAFARVMKFSWSVWIMSLRSSRWNTAISPAASVIDGSSMSCMWGHRS